MMLTVLICVYCGIAGALFGITMALDGIIGGKRTTWYEVLALAALWPILGAALAYISIEEWWKK